MTIYQPLPSVEFLNSLLEEKEPGVLHYRVRGSSRVPAGARAGNIFNGYCTINIRGYKYLRHRLIWKMHHGVDPVGVIHHVNDTPGNDWIENLRDVTASENARGDKGFVVAQILDTPNGYVESVRFHIDLWGDEDSIALRDELEALISPIITKLVANRVGRKRVR